MIENSPIKVAPNEVMNLLLGLCMEVLKLVHSTVRKEPFDFFITANLNWPLS